MSRQLTTYYLADDDGNESITNAAIVGALRISGPNAPTDVSPIGLAVFWGWALRAGIVAELRRVSNAIYERQYDDSCFVYFIGDPRRKVVKIGVSTDVGRRLTSIQTGYPYPLSILCVIPGDEVLESELQRIFSPLRTNGEWFRYDWRIRTYVGITNAELFARVVGS